MFNKKDVDYSLYLVTDRGVLGDKPLLTSIEAAIKGGVTLVQLREKEATTREFYQIAKEVKALTSAYQIPLIINDRLDIALAVHAQGVHVGNEDMPIPVVRQLLGPDRLIGASANCVEEALTFQSQGVNYLGVGAMYPTTTKNNTEKVSLETLKAIKETVRIPIVAIGGINEGNAREVLATSVDGLAVVSCLLGKDDIYQATRQLISLYP